MKKINFLIPLLLAFSVSCANSPNQNTESLKHDVVSKKLEKLPEIKGSVFFADNFSIKATQSELLDSATVSLIEPESGR